MLAAQHQGDAPPPSEDARSEDSSSSVVLAFGRAESDDRGNHTLYDIVVQDSYRGLGLGALLVHSIMSRLGSSLPSRDLGFDRGSRREAGDGGGEGGVGAECCNVTLTSEPKTVGFYTGLGFEVCGSCVIVGKVHAY
ncbi:MAG: hypothetical protein WDW38_011132 [Sanguina aurantia]